MLGQFSLAGFVLGSIDASVYAVIQTADGPSGSKRRRYRYGEKLTKAQEYALQLRLRRLRELQKEKEDELERQAIAAEMAALEAQILAMLEAWPEEQAPIVPEPYQPSFDLISAFNSGERAVDQQAMAQLSAQIEAMRQQAMIEAKRAQEQDDEEAILLLS